MPGFVAHFRFPESFGSHADLVQLEGKVPVASVRVTFTVFKQLIALQSETSLIWLAAQIPQPRPIHSMISDSLFLSLGLTREILQRLGMGRLGITPGSKDRQAATGAGR